MGIIAFLKSQFICHLLICYIFVVTGLIINLLQLCTLIIWPINKQLYRRINCRLAYCIASQLVWLLEWWSCTECTLYTDQKDYIKYGKENAIVILNHNYEIDFLCGWDFCERFGVLGFLIHCEGTRFTEKKHQISMQVAEAKGLPKLKYHLLPRTKGFALTVQCLRNAVPAVYDATLNFRNGENPTLLGTLHGKKYHADLYVRRIPLEEIPEDEGECAAWLHKLYQEKDMLQEEYFKRGFYPGTPIVPAKRPWVLVNWLFWAALLLFPLFKLVANMICNRSSLTLITFSLIIVAASVGMRWMIGMTEIEKGSSYGNNGMNRKN
ncbi:1-acyl-sn-glycerol-3-phosphate acyltransferase delta isoform X2 [Carcharodon carcharias]|uniref:1-acyl-sn-glycerol-3-phosphate acyltransferase delta isoform X2 n=1 Tax=Carcharodon carcharias TaxID=13397 RepID=UPI001B7F112E|nr:1-acyl-sn-glycerol-3-phosphate acyltransferase delta isoform X2 [Carcharodon carcharias]